MTNQPSYWCIANFGDVNPYEHGGKFLLVDRRGIYPPTVVTINAELPDDDDDCGDRIVHRIELDELTVIKGADQAPTLGNNWIGLSDNKFHPNLIAWYGRRESLKKVADSVGCEIGRFMNMLIANDPIEKMTAFMAIVDYHGPVNFDSYPETVDADKARLMCDRFLAQIAESEKWHDGYFDASLDSVRQTVA